MQGANVGPGFLQKVIEVAARGTIERIVRDLEPRFADGPEVHLAANVVEVRGSRVGRLAQRLSGLRTLERAFAGKHLAGQALDFPRNLGQRRRAVGAGEFQAVVFGRIVTGSDVDAAIQAIRDNLVGQRRGRVRSSRDPGFHPVRIERLGRCVRKVFRKKAGVVAHDDPRPL